MSNGLMTEKAMRVEVAESWQRSAAAGVTTDRVDAPVTIGEHDLRDVREAHPLSRVFPLLDDVIGQAIRDCDAMMAISDAAGQLLWVLGNPATLRRAERIGFVEGSNWDERLAGTNAPGLVIATNSSATVTRAEHFRASVQPWSCAATPIHDPGTTRLLGVLDVTGGDQLVVPQTMAMLRAAARMAESELALDALTRAPADAPAGTGMHVLLEALGRAESLLTVDDGRGRVTTIRLTPRHSEILLLLASAPRGLSGDELAVLLYEDDGASSTLRAELNRLRGLLGEELLASRPYRLVAGVTGDWLAAEAQLAAGDLRGAIRAYTGPLLPRSTAPGVVRLRDVLEGSLRRALLRSGEADLMSTWTRAPWGRNDYELWTAQRAAVGDGSPMIPLIEGQIARLDRELH